MGLKDRSDGGSNPYVLPRIAEQVAYHSDIVRVGQFHQHGDIRPMPFEGAMNRVPNPLIAVDAALSGHFLPDEIEGVAAMADPFRPPLPRAASRTGLDFQCVLPCRLPIAGACPSTPAAATLRNATCMGWSW